MAVSDLLPRKASGERTRKQVLKERLNYEQKGEKTRDGELVSAYMCSPESAAEEFETARLLYGQITGRSQPAGRDIIAYRILQSFKPGEIEPEDANRLGYELAMKFTKGKHQFVVSTHTDKAHIHNHVEFNSINLSCDGKFNNYKNSSLALRQLNDKMCREHGYSVVEKPGKKRPRYQEKAAAERGRSYKEKLRECIDKALPGCRDFEEFLTRMRAEGYEVKRRGKSLEFLAPGQQRFTRLGRLGEGYTEKALRERIASGGRGVSVAGQGRTASGGRINLLVDIRKKMEEGKGKGYENWAKIFNLKEAAKTLNFLTEMGVEDYDTLAERAEMAGEKFDRLSAKIRQLEGRMAQTAELKFHVINYSKTREVYREYRRCGSRKEYYESHKDAVEKHLAAKAAFDALGGKPVPKAVQLSEEYAGLLAEKKRCYEEYKAAKKEMNDYRTAKQNVDRILGLIPGKVSDRKKEMER